MFHLYLVTNANGSWPLLREEPLAETVLPNATAVVALLGRFDQRETASAALALARGAVCGPERRDDAPADAARRWLVSRPPLPTAQPPGARRRRSGRRSIPR
jgi:hypothetical protein